MLTWRTIPSFPKYEASSAGDIRRSDTGVCLQPFTDDRGYSKVTLPDEAGAVQSVWAHRLVCAAFHGAPDGREVRHLSGNKSDNRPDNLRWGTRVENAADRKQHMAEKSLPYAGLRPHHPLKTHPDAAGALGKFLGAPVTVRGVRKAYATGLINKNKALELIRSLSPP